MNLWILKNETSDKKGFEFINAISNHTLLIESVQIRNFDFPDKLVLRGQVIIKESSVVLEPFHPRPAITPQVGIIDVPSKTMILIRVPRQNSIWWHMGSKDNRPLMQIVGELRVTNISIYGVFAMSAKLRKPEAVGQTMVRDQESGVYGDHVIPQGAIGELLFDFHVQPPILEVGTPLVTDVAIVDQFGNEHWIEGLEFQYL